MLTALGENVERLLEISSQAADASSETAEGLAKFAHAMANGAPAQSAPAGPQPTAETRIILAEAIIMTYNDQGQPAYKITGHPYSKYGVRVWPEVLPKLGVEAVELQPGPNPFSAQVVVLMGEKAPYKGPKKILGLAPERAVEEPPF